MSLGREKGEQVVAIVRVTEEQSCQVITDITVTKVIQGPWDVAVAEAERLNHLRGADRSYRYFPQATKLLTVVSKATPGGEDQT